MKRLSSGNLIALPLVFLMWIYHWYWLKLLCNYAPCIQDLQTLAEAKNNDKSWCVSNRLVYSLIAVFLPLSSSPHSPHYWTEGCRDILLLYTSVLWRRVALQRLIYSFTLALLLVPYNCTQWAKLPSYIMGAFATKKGKLVTGNL